MKDGVTWVSVNLNPIVFASIGLKISIDTGFDCFIWVCNFVSLISPEPQITQLSYLSLQVSYVTKMALIETYKCPAAFQQFGQNRFCNHCSHHELN